MTACIIVGISLCKSSLHLETLGDVVDSSISSLILVLVLVLFLVLQLQGGLLLWVLGIADRLNLRIVKDSMCSSGLVPLL